MTAAAAAAQSSQTLANGRSDGVETTFVVAFAVAGGLVEGLALGLAQSRGLSSWLGRRRRVAWLPVTLAVAGIGWTVASAQTALADEDAAEPELTTIMAGAVVVGLAMGALLGAAQALVLQGSTRHPWRWVGANLAAWSVAVPIIFVSASIASANWSVASVMAWAAATGGFAGALVGVVSGWFLRSVNGTSAHNRAILGLLESPIRRVLPRSLAGLRVQGIGSGIEVTLPVMYAADEEGLVVVPGHTERKRWWRNLRRPAPLEVLLHGTWRSARGEVLEPGDGRYTDAVATYWRRRPRVPGLGHGPLVRNLSGRPVALVWGRQL